MTDPIFPDGTIAIEELLDQQTFGGEILTAGKHMPIEDYNNLPNKPFVLITGQGGPVGYIDQAERVRLEIHGTNAHEIAKDVRSRIPGENITTAEGFLDQIKLDQVPTTQEQTDRIDLAVILITVITRPKN